MNGNNKKAFTLVELMVAGAVFVIIFAVITGVLAKSIKYQKYNLAHNRLMNEASYAMEYMVRALRMAQIGDGSSGCPNGYTYSISPSSRVTFTDYAGDCKRFYRNSSTRQLTMVSGADTFALTSDDFEVLDLQFIKDGDDFGAGDGRQPRMTIYLKMEEKKLPDKPIIVLQTTVSQRNLDM